MNNNQKTSLLELNSNRQETIEIILNDLYKIDASLKQHEAELRELINQLIESKPASKLDENFRAELREQILKMAQEIKLNTKFGKSKFVWADIFMAPFLKPAGLVIGGILLALIVTVPIMLKQGRGEVEGINDFFALEVTETKDKAFGSLSLDSSAELAQAPTASPQAVAEVVADGRGGGGVMMSAEKESSMDMSAIQEPMYIGKTNYEYKYVGDEFTIDEQELPVFQRIKDSGAGSGLASFLGGLSFQGLDLSKFKNAKVQNFSVVEDKDNGYMVNVDLVNGMVSVYKNWARWDIQTARRESLKMSDLPNDKSVIAIADKFLGHYGIDFIGYGLPEVQKDWLDYSEQEVGGDEVWVPDTLTVIYPFLMNGEPVYDMGGRKTGVTVSVDIINMQAVAIYNLTGRQYESSSYEIETDVDKILEVAKTKNGYYGYYGSGDAKEIVEFEIGTPQIIMMQYTKYEEGESMEFIVPALIFPVTKVSETDVYFQKNIIIPLVKELLEGQSRQTGLIPMPLLETTTVDEVSIPVVSPPIPELGEMIEE